MMDDGQLDSSSGRGLTAITNVSSHSHVSLARGSSVDSDESVDGAGNKGEFL